MSKPYRPRYGQTMTEIHPAAAGLNPAESIRADSAALAVAAQGHFELPVPSCPDWSVADLVWHLLEVQSFWTQVIERKLTDPVEEIPTPRPADDELLDGLSSATERMLDVFAGSNADEAIWTWASQKDVGFIVRHQIQEAAVHRWDAENAVSTPTPLGLAAAVDSIEEFLTFTGEYRADDAPAIDVPVLLVATDADAAWLVAENDDHDVTWQRVSPTESAAARVSASSSDLLLYLYHRVPPTALDVAGPADVIGQLPFRFYTA